MDTPGLYRLLADVVLALHFGVVAFVVGGALAVLLGGPAGWAWVRRPLWRWAHLGAIGFVVLQSWLGADCPLTVLESSLRVRALGADLGAGQAQGFIEYWVQRLLYYEAPGWVFGLVYSLFGLLVLVLWWRYPPGKADREELARAGRRGQRRAG